MSGMSMLRPGLHVVRHDADHLQVGIDPPWRVVLPDQPDVRRVLAALRAGETPVPTTDAAHRALQSLARAGMLVDPPAAGGGRAVAVRAAADLRDEVVRVVRTAGCDPDPDAPVALVVAGGELARPDVDAELRDGRAHLPVSAGAHGWTIGPFVVPGVSACLRCVDAHRGEQDPRRGLVVDQLAGLPAAPDDPVLCALVLSWAVRDLLTHLDGGRPSTWSSTVDIGADLRPRHRSWARHPHCGCSWLQAA